MENSATGEFGMSVVLSSEENKPEDRRRREWNLLGLGVRDGD